MFDSKVASENARLKSELHDARQQMIKLLLALYEDDKPRKEAIKAAARYVLEKHDLAEMVP
jgi:hypothetical protein